MVTALLFLAFATSVFGTQYNCTGMDGFIFWGARCEKVHNNFVYRKHVTCNCAKEKCNRVNSFHSYMISCSSPRQILNSHYRGPQEIAEIECDTNGNSCFLCKIPGQHFDRCIAEYGKNTAWCTWKNSENKLRLECQRHGILVQVESESRNLNCSTLIDSSAISYDDVLIKPDLEEIHLEGNYLTVQESGLTPGFWALIVTVAILTIVIGVAAFMFIKFKQRRNVGGVAEVKNETKLEPIYCEITECAADIVPNNDGNLYSEVKENMYANDEALKTLREESEYLEVLK
ncbi:uncharacterized protein LOC135937134 isoform X2 [Cloeon dipterum]|uniref:uncharacterized protein LOC135937134 isoform X2 n=1 Tax=Cloeon dipterum TaxID=197152 RepID=UPI0032207328